MSQLQYEAASVQQLTPEQRGRARRYLWLGYSAKRIAEITGLPRFAVETMKIMGEVHRW